jgi:hypothetical protein
VKVNSTHCYDFAALEQYENKGRIKVGAIDDAALGPFRPIPEIGPEAPDEKQTTTLNSLLTRFQSTVY